MHRFRIRSCRVASAVAALAVPLALVACGDDDEPSANSTTPSGGSGTETDETDGGEGVNLVDAGSEDGQIELPGSPEVGQAGSGSMTIDMSVAVEGPDVPDSPVAISVGIDTRAEIVEATDSSYVAETTISDTEVRDAPDGADTSAIEGIVGVTYSQEFAADGTPGEIELVNGDELSDEQKQAFDEISSQLNSAAAVTYPSDPVGVGARWSSTSIVAAEGFEIPLTYEYELTAVEGDTYIIETAYDQDIDEEVEQGGETGHVTGKVSGGGTTNGSVANPLLVSMSVSQNMDLDIEVEDQTFEMTMDVGVELETTDR